MIYPLKKPGFLSFTLWLKKYWIYLLIYAFFLYVSSTSARAGDDWEVAAWYDPGAVLVFAGVTRALLYFVGRLLANFFVSFFGYYDFLWIILAPAFFTSIIYFINRLFRNEQKWLPVLITFLMLISVSNEMRIETFTNLVANVNYIPAIASILLYLNIVFDENTDRRFRFWQSDRMNYITVALLAVSIGLWIENVTVGFIAGNLLISLLFFMRNKRIPPIALYGLIGSFIGGIIMFGSPGFYVRYAAQAGSDIGLFQRIAINMPQLMKEFVMDNLFIYLVFFIVLGFSVFTGKLRVSSKLKTFFLIFISFVTFVIVIILFLGILFESYFSVNFPIIGKAHSFVQNIFYIVDDDPLTSQIEKLISIWGVVFSFLLLLTIFIPAVVSPQREKTLVLYCIGLASAFVMSATPYLGARTFVLAITMIIAITSLISSSLELKSPDVRKGVIILLIFAIGLQADKFFLNGQYVMKINAMREDLIQDYRARWISGKLSKDEWLVLPAYKDNSILSTANVQGVGGHMDSFKRYYQLPSDANVIVDDGFAVKSFNVTPISGNTYYFEIVPLRETSRYTYQFLVQWRTDKDIDIYNTGEIKDNFISYELPGSGTFVISCYIIEKNVGMRRFTAPNLIEIE